MKIRTGFVSNSSSSSFIVYTGNMSRKQIKQLDDTLEEIRLEMNKENDIDEDEDYNASWGESDQTWSKEGRNFYIIETYYLPGHLMDKLDKLIPKHDSVSVYM